MRCLRGMVVMQLTLNHIHIMEKMVPGLSNYAEMKHQSEPVLLITHIFADSQLYRMRTVTPGSTINEINGIKVTTLAELREALKKSTHEKFLTIKASDNLMRVSDNLLVVLPWDRVLKKKILLSHDYHYPISPIVKGLLAARLENKHMTPNPMSLPLA